MQNCWQKQQRSKIKITLCGATKLHLSTHIFFMNKLPDDVKQVVFEYFANTCQEMAVLELLSKAWKKRLFLDAQTKHLSMWRNMLFCKLCIPSTDQTHAKQILKQYKSHQFDLVADQDVEDFIAWVKYV